MSCGRGTSSVRTVASRCHAGCRPSLPRAARVGIRTHRSDCHKPQLRSAQNVLASCPWTPTLEGSIRSALVKSATIRVLVVSDIRLYRDGLAHILADEPRLAVVGTAADVSAAVREVAAHAPDVGPVDMVMPQSIDAGGGMPPTRPTVKGGALGLSRTQRGLLGCGEARVAVDV